MKIPNGHQAIVDERKLRDYCLDPAHPRGRHKARPFASALGIYRENASILRQALLGAVMEEEATPGARDEYGQRYIVDFEMTGPSGNARIRSAWIVLVAENFPRLTSCYVL
jgi:uncharacterized protein DUF6883